MNETTPVKRSRNGSPKHSITRDTRIVPTSLKATGNEAMRHATEDTNFISLEVAPFVLAGEMRPLLIQCFSKQAEQGIGRIMHAKKKGSEKSFLVVEIHDQQLGDSIIASLAERDYCNTPLNPSWISAVTWATFFTVWAKGSQRWVSSSTTIQRIKQQCPQSHHKQLDELIGSASDEFEVIEEYRKWFGDHSFSPFGMITHSTF